MFCLLNWRSITTIHLFISFIFLKYMYLIRHIYVIQTTENKVQLLSEEVRRLNLVQEETKRENERLKERLSKLEKMMTSQSQSR